MFAGSFKVSPWGDLAFKREIKLLVELRQAMGGWGGCQIEFEAADTKVDKRGGPLFLTSRDKVGVVIDLCYLLTFLLQNRP